MPPSKPYIGIDLGGTNMQIGVVSPDGKMLSQTKKKTKSEEGYEGVLERIAEGVAEATAGAGLPVSGIGGRNRLAWRFLGEPREAPRHHFAHHAVIIAGRDLGRLDGVGPIVHF